MEKWKAAGCVAAAVTAGVVGLAFPGKAAPAAKPVPTIGFVDLSTVTDYTQTYACQFSVLLSSSLGSRVLSRPR